MVSPHERARVGGRPPGSLPHRGERVTASGRARDPLVLVDGRRHWSRSSGQRLHPRPDDSRPPDTPPEVEARGRRHALTREAPAGRALRRRLSVPRSRGPHILAFLAGLLGRASPGSLSTPAAGGAILRWGGRRHMDGRRVGLRRRQARKRCARFGRKGATAPGGCCQNVEPAPWSRASERVE